jgi:hypothetical protein
MNSGQELLFMHKGSSFFISSSQFEYFVKGLKLKLYPTPARLTQVPTTLLNLYYDRVAPRPGGRNPHTARKFKKYSKPLKRKMNRVFFLSHTYWHIPRTIWFLCVFSTKFAGRAGKSLNKKMHFEK